MVAVKFKHTNFLSISFFLLSALLLMLSTPKKLLVTAKTYSCFLIKHILICKPVRSLTNGSRKLLNYLIKFCELLYFLTYYFLIKLFVVFAELMWINQLLFIQNYWLCSHVAITLNNPDFKINSLLYLLY